MRSSSSARAPLSVSLKISSSAWRIFSCLSFSNRENSRYAMDSSRFFNFSNSSIISKTNNLFSVLSFKNITSFVFVKFSNSYISSNKLSICMYWSFFILTIFLLYSSFNAEIEEQYVLSYFISHKRKKQKGSSVLLLYKSVFS